MKPFPSLVLHVSIAPATVNWVLKPSEISAWDPGFWMSGRVWKDHMSKGPVSETSGWPCNQEVVTARKRSMTAIHDLPQPLPAPGHTHPSPVYKTDLGGGERPASPQQGWMIPASLWHWEELESALRPCAPKNPWEVYRKGGSDEDCVKLCCSYSHRSTALQAVLTSSTWFNLHAPEVQSLGQHGQKHLLRPIQLTQRRVARMDAFWRHPSLSADCRESLDKQLRLKAQVSNH